MWKLLESVDSAWTHRRWLVALSSLHTQSPTANFFAPNCNRMDAGLMLLNVSENYQYSWETGLKSSNLLSLICLGIQINVDVTSGHLQWFCLLKQVNAKVSVHNLPEVPFRRTPSHIPHVKWQVHWGQVYSRLISPNKAVKCLQADTDAFGLDIPLHGASCETGCEGLDFSLRFSRPCHCLSKNQYLNQTITKLYNILIRGLHGYFFLIVENS